MKMDVESIHKWIQSLLDTKEEQQTFTLLLFMCQSISKIEFIEDDEYIMSLIRIISPYVNETHSIKEKIIQLIHQVYKKIQYIYHKKLSWKVWIKIIDLSFTCDDDIVSQLDTQMLDNIPLTFWESSHKILNSSCHRGSILLEVFTRFYNGLSLKILDTEKRCLTIVKEYIYFSDSSKFNVFITTFLLSLEIRNRCNKTIPSRYLNRYISKLNPMEKWSDIVFDVVIEHHTIESLKEIRKDVLSSKKMEKNTETKAFEIIQYKKKVKEEDKIDRDEAEPFFSKKELSNYERQQYKCIFKNPKEEYAWARLQKKTCSKCSIEKKLSDFNGNTSGTDAFDKQGYRLRRPECKECTIKVFRGKKEAKEKAKAFGISYIAPEGTLCAVCNKSSSIGNGIVFDHCHDKNIFRGYCCNSCNRSIGVLGDNVDGLLKAINYLLKTEKCKIIQDESGELIKM